jgi:hypothetical protein
MSAGRGGGPGSRVDTALTEVVAQRSVATVTCSSCGRSWVGHFCRGIRLSTPATTHRVATRPIYGRGQVDDRLATLCNMEVFLVEVCRRGSAYIEAESAEEAGKRAAELVYDILEEPDESDDIDVMYALSAVGGPQVMPEDAVVWVGGAKGSWVDVPDYRNKLMAEEEPPEL